MVILILELDLLFLFNDFSLDLLQFGSFGCSVFLAYQLIIIYLSIVAVATFNPAELNQLDLMSIIGLLLELVEKTFST